MEPTFEKLKQYYLELPESTRAVLSSPEMAETLLAIGRDNGLRVDELDALSKQTGMVLLGVTHPDQYVAKLRAALPLSADKVEPIAQAVNAQIFSLVHEAVVSPTAKPVVAPAPAPTNPVQTQMQGAFRMAPDSVTIKPTPTAPVVNGTYATDPYREPTN